MVMDSNENATADRELNPGPQCLEASTLTTTLMIIIKAGLLRILLVQ